MSESTLAVDYATLVRAAAKNLGTGQTYNSGTVTVAAGVVTLTGGSFPSWAATACINIGDRNYYAVATRSSSTSLILSDTSVSVTGPTKYVLLQTLSIDKENDFQDIDDLIDQALLGFYAPHPIEGQKEPHRWSFLNPTATVKSVADSAIIDLPDNCTSATREWTVAIGSTVYPITVIRDGQMRSIAGTSSNSTGPKYVTIRPKPMAENQDSGQRFEAVFDTPFDDAYDVSFVYSLIPDRLTPVNPYPYGGAMHSETVRSAVLAKCEKFKDCVDGMYFQEYQRRLGASLQIDVETKLAVTGTYPITAPTFGTYQWFQQEIGQSLNLSPNFNSWDHSTIRMVDSYIQRGLRLFYMPPLSSIVNHVGHRWSFLRPEIEINIHGPYSTGTVAVASGVVTLTGGTFPTWAAAGELVISNVAYHVASRDSGTQLTLVDTEVTVASGTSYSLQQTAYTLPASVSSIDGPLQFRRSSSNRWSDVAMIDMHSMRRMMQNNFESPTFPRYAALKLHNPQAAATGTTREIVFWPPPDGDYTIIGGQRTIPSQFSTGYPAGGPEHYQTMLYAMLSVAEPKQYAELFLRQLDSSIEYDQSEHTPESLGLNTDRGMLPEFDSIGEVPRRYSSLTNTL